MNRSLSKTRSQGYSECIKLITDAGHRGAQAQAKALAASAGKTMADLAYIDGFSQALEDTKALALAPDDWHRPQGRSRREP